MSIFHRNNITFKNHDPLDDGLKDAIAAEQSETESFSFDDVSGDELVEQWSTIIRDVEKDPDWFTFEKD